MSLMKETSQLSIPEFSPNDLPFTSLNQFLDCQIQHLPIKRTFDILFSVTALFACTPILILLSLITFCTSPGKIFYSHTRIGRGGKPFKCYKFRSMYPDAERRLNEILDADSELKREWETTFKLKNDPRITPFGSFLRKSSLDELPQFWNVLKGDLSVVGPRPVIEEEVQKFLGAKAIKILSIRPGLTGPWQVSGRSNISCYAKRIELDEFYVDNHSLTLDISLIAKTIPVMLFSRGAY
jgi:exopolysaccharide production protein ExoY